MLCICVISKVLWKSYIDFEIEQEEYDHTRGLYQRLLQRTQHVKVCIVSLHVQSLLALSFYKQPLTSESCSF